MTALAIVAVSCVGVAVGTVAARAIAGHLAWQFALARNRSYSHYKSDDPPSGDQWFGAWSLAIASLVILPVVLIAAVSGRVFKIGAERSADLHKREKRVAAMEKELGL